MYTRVNQRICAFFFLLWGGIHSPCVSKQSLNLVKSIQECLSHATLCNAVVGIYAINVDKDKEVYALNANTSLIPASSFKVLTTAAALEVLGKDFRFETHLQHDGIIDEKGTLHGNIYIKGLGDPALGSTAFDAHYYKPYFIDTWIQAIEKAGIKRVEGGIIGDAQLYEKDPMIGDNCAWGDLGADYATSCSALSIFDNTYKVRLTPVPNGGVLASIAPSSPCLPKDIKLINRVEAASSDSVDTHCLPYEKKLIIDGSINKNNASFTVKGAIPDSAYWAACVLHDGLEQKGIQVMEAPLSLHTPVCAKTPTNRQLLAVTTSPTLSEIIRVTNHQSMNLYADHLAVRLSLARNGKATLQDGAAALKDFWCDKGLSPEGFFLDDASGLARSNAITPRHLVNALLYIRKRNAFELFYNSLPVAGESGTLKDVFTRAPLKGNMRAKSGSMRRIIGYTGYLKNSAGETIVFSCIVNQYNGTRSNVLPVVEQILTLLAQ